MSAFLRSRAKVIALIAGFLFSVVGTLWALLVTDRLDGQIQQIAGTRTANAVQIDRLQRLASEYFMANQQGDLIFIMGLQPGANRDLAASVYQGNILDRATPVQNMIGALGEANQLDFDQVYGTYLTLNEQAKENFTMETFSRLKGNEREIIMQGQERAFALAEENAGLDQVQRAKQSQQSRNNVLGVLAAIVGSAALLAANLIVEKSGPEKSGPQPPPD
ncbi:MAG: hypothetical protein FGM25_03215 [Mycobacterium sp.]|nr:hypothetical protein [Mycobacterium sp.]